MEMTIRAASPDEALALFGLGDRNLKLLRDALDVDLSARGRVVRLAGEKEPVEQAASVLNDIISLYRSGVQVEPDHLERQLAAFRESVCQGGDSSSRGGGNGDGLAASSDSEVGGGQERRTTEVDHHFVDAVARSPGQKRYMRAIFENDVVFCTGPAGTGKTFLAVRLAAHFLHAGDIKRLILCRPAVEAGEKLGFLPGDFQAKINPYLRPLHDALNDTLEFDQLKRYMEREIIEIIPLAYMRGRTLNNAFIILDEGQNTTVSQMKMFLTRMGMNSKIVVNGDVTQADLPEGQMSGLTHATGVIRDISGIGWVNLEKSDIVRHPLVRRIVEAYEKGEASGE